MKKMAAGHGTKLFIIPWFGKYPDWLDQWVANMELLKPKGYEYLIVSNLELFKKRVKEKLGIEANIIAGTGKVWDYRPMLGVLFEEELAGYDYWGHTDFDCVYGNVEKWEPPEYEIWSNHDEYICGPWTLYQNTDKINNLFRKCGWKKYLDTPEPTGWAEQEFSRRVEKKTDYRYTFHQTKDLNQFDLSWHNGLYDGDLEIMMCHFKRTKLWPLSKSF